MKVHEKKEKKAKFRISFVILFIIASFAACFVFYMKEDFVIPTDIPVSSTPSGGFEDDSLSDVDDDISTSENSIVNPVPISNMEDFSFLNKSFFVGKDLQGYYDLGIFPKKNIFSNDSFSFETLNGDGFELYNKISDGEYENVYFFADYSDVTADFSSYFDEFDKFLADFENSNVNFYLVSALPTKDTSENSTINKFNSELLNYANLNGISYLDINIEFIGADGKISGDFVDNDGKTTEDSLEKIRDYILCHVKNEMV